MARTLLLNWVYYNPAGHIVEGMKIARGYAAANRGIDVHMMVNADAPAELAERAPWVAKTWAVDAEEVVAKGRRAQCLRGVPKSWDWIVYDDRPERRPEDHHRWLLDYHGWCKEQLHATRWHGGADERFSADSPPERPAYLFDERIEIRPPAEAARWAGRFQHQGPLIAILPCGSWHAPWYPTVDAWDRMIGAIFDELPNARVVLTGTRAKGGGRTTSRAFGRRDVDELMARHPRLEQAWEVGLWKQVALVRRASVFIAPHSGFGFIAPAVGTPWLTVSGGSWPELFFNGVPFFSVLPDCPVYPCYGRVLPGCIEGAREGARMPCMNDSRDFEAGLLDGLKKLLDPAFGYDEAVAEHVRKVRTGPWEARRFFSHDLAIDFTGTSRPEWIAQRTRRR